MTGDFQNFKIGAKKISARRFFNEKIRLYRFDLELEPEVAKKFTIGNHGRGERVTADGTAELALNPANILDVIDMPVCEEQKLEIDIKRTPPFASALGRIEKNPALWRLKQITIGFENSAAKAFVIHCDLPYPSVATAEGESFYELIECSLFSIV